jgi:ATP-dependent RNA helicase DDX35
MSRQHFQRPSYDDDGETTLVMEERAGTSDPNDQNSLIFHNPHLSLSLHQQRSRLPISKFRNQLLYLSERYRCTVIVGATGSGKSTQVPQVSYPFNIFNNTDY